MESVKHLELHEFPPKLELCYTMLSLGRQNITFKGTNSDVLKCLCKKI